ncbi:MAG: metal ABC transporter ATP-binding protein [Chloroflexaceae bacterium]|nr:metal ABC transporter ATP-binding protein [Chloroflexaceae bacterium]NJL32559.1 metal ABC transporter ATP-binding protein [Chloroflexaceae bacterium]NJO07435.1 metal ABC transporter ATP-binding protein [Chloroflexaceae bacterium]
MAIQSGATAEDAVLVVEHLTVLYQQTFALDNISFAIPAGERVAVVGPNGAGKSTLFKVIAGLIKPNRGTVRACGHLHERCAKVAYVPQRAQINWAFPVTVRDVVLMGRVGHVGLLRWYRRRDHELVQTCLEMVRMTDLADRQIGELSGGQQQRVFIARALAQEAQILLMDEPVTGLDLRSQEEVLHIIDDIHQHGVTILVATHNLNEAADAEHYERVMLLNRRLVGIGSAREVMTGENLAAAYGTHLHRIETDQGVLLLHDRH